MSGRNSAIAQQVKANNRELRSSNRELERDRRKLETEERRLIGEIKKYAASNNKPAVQILTQQLIKIRDQKGQSMAASGQLQGLVAQNAMMQSNFRVASAMNSTTQTMAKMNNIMNPEETTRVAQQFTEEQMKLAVKDDMITAALEASLAQEGDSEEEDAIVQEVLSEVGISLHSQLNRAPAVPRNASSMGIHQREPNEMDAELERILANPRS